MRGARIGIPCTLLGRDSEAEGGEGSEEAVGVDEREGDDHPAKGELLMEREALAQPKVEQDGHGCP